MCDYQLKCGLFWELRYYLLRLLSEVCVALLVFWVNRSFSLSSPNEKTIALIQFILSPNKVSESNSLSKMWWTNYKEGKNFTLTELSLGCVGLHPAGLQGLYWPSFKTKVRAQSQQQRHQWFLVGGWAYTSEARSPSNTPPCAADDGQDVTAVFTPGGRGEVTIYRGKWRQVGSWVTRETRRGHAPHRPFEKLSVGDVLI